MKDKIRQNPTGHRGKRWRALLILPPLLAGILIASLLIQGRQGPQQENGEEKPQSVSAIIAPTVRVVPRAIGYGIVQPRESWQGIAEVSGRIIARHPRLDPGVILPKDTVLLRIDPTDYELRIAEIEAEIQGKEAQLAELVIRERNTQRSLDIERRSLAVARRELARKEELRERNSISQSVVEQEERNVLQQESSVQALENTLALIPSERQRLQAELERNQSRLAQARRELERTTMTLPFAARIAAVNVEEMQFAAVGQTLVAADGIAVAEIPAQVPVDRFRRLLSPGSFSGGLSVENLQDLLARQEFAAQVRLPIGETTVSWDGRVDRLSESLDPETRTVGVVVAVDQPYANARPPKQPPLVKNMYVEVEIRGKPREETVIVPRSSLHGDRIYVVGKDNRLQIRPVKIGFTQADFATVQAGIDAGETVLVGDLIPAIEGMLLAPIIDRDITDRLLSQAQGKDVDG